jgi:hypothetical protein
MENAHNQRLVRVIVYTPEGPKTFGEGPEENLIVNARERMLQEVQPDGRVVGYYGFPMVMVTEPTLITRAPAFDPNGGRHR